MKKEKRHDDILEDQDEESDVELLGKEWVCGKKQGTKKMYNTITQCILHI